MKQSDKPTNTINLKQNNSELGFDTLIDAFVNKWGEIINITVHGELYDNKFYYSYTQFDDCWSYDLAVKSIIEYEENFKKIFDRIVKAKEIRFRKRVNYNFGFLTDYIPKCLTLLELAVFRIKQQEAIITVSLLEERNELAYKMKCYHKRLSLNITSEVYIELEEKFKTQKAISNYDNQIILHQDTYEQIRELKKIKLMMLQKVYNHISNYYEKMREDLILRFDKPFFTVKEPEKLEFVLLSLLSANIISINNPKENAFLDLPLKKRQEQFRKLIVNFNLEDRDTLISDIAQKNDKNHSKIRKLFDELQKSLPLPETKIKDHKGF